MIADFKKDLEAKIRASFLMLLHDCVQLKEFDNPYFNPIRDDIYQAAMDIHNIPNLDNHWETITVALKSLYSYKIFFNLTDKWINSIRVNKLAADTVEHVLTGEEFFLEHMKDLMGDDKVIDTDMLCECMGLIPLRMTTANYFDYVSDAVLEIKLPLNDLFAEDFKRLFAPMRYVGDEAWLSDVKVDLEKLWATGEDEEIKEDHWETITDVHFNLVQTNLYASTLFDALCALKILQKSCEQQIEYADISFYEEFKDSKIKDKDFSEKLDKAIEQHMQGIVFHANQHIETDGFDEETQALYERWQPINKLFYDNSFYYFMYAPNTPTETLKQDVPAFMSLLKSFMQETTDALSGKRKRFLRQNFLQFLPYPYDVEDYHDYFMETFEKLDDVNRRLMTIYIFKEDDMDAEDFEDEDDDFDDSI